MPNDDLTPGGSRILRHQAADGGDSEVAHADDERMTAHLERCLGAPATVWHELVSDLVHIDIHVVPPTPARRNVALVTSGMSARPMNVPPDLADRAAWQHAELCMFLPPDWPLDQASFDDERRYWPIRLLKTLARLPHQYDTWLGWGHSIPNGDPARPYVPDTQLAGALVLPPFAFDDTFFVVPGEPVLHLFQVLPVTAAEMAYKLARGADALIEQLEEAFPEIFGALAPARASAV